MKLRHALAAESAAIMTREDGTKVVYGYASVFKSRNSYNEIFSKGAFARSLEDEAERSRIVHLLHHDTRTALGVPVLEEDKKGLYFETEPLPTPLAMAALVEIERGALKGVSIGFDLRADNPTGYQWVEKKSGGYIAVTDVRLWEISSVRWGS